MMIFVLVIFADAEVLVYSQSFIAKENVAKMSSAITVANYVWPRSSTCKGEVFGNAFCCFTPVS